MSRAFQWVDRVLRDGVRRKAIALKQTWSKGHNGCFRNVSGKFQKSKMVQIDPKDGSGADVKGQNI